MSDDLIKRSDAIKAIKEHHFFINNQCKYPSEGCVEVIEDAINVPSADRPQDDDWEKYSDKLWKNAYERGKADRPQGEFTKREYEQFLHGISLSLLSKRSAQHWGYKEETAQKIRWLEALEQKVRAHMKGADDDD